jgi:hypothetical protein
VLSIVDSSMGPGTSGGTLTARGEAARWARRPTCVAEARIKDTVLALEGQPACSLARAGRGCERICRRRFFPHRHSLRLWEHAGRVYGGRRLQCAMAGPAKQFGRGRPSRLRDGCFRQERGQRSEHGLSGDRVPDKFVPFVRFELDTSPGGIWAFQLWAAKRKGSKAEF